MKLGFRVKVLILFAVLTAIVVPTESIYAGLRDMQSLRFNDDDSSNLQKTFSSAGNRKIWTWSGWVKLANLSGASQKAILSAYTASTDSGYLVLRLGGAGSDTLEVSGWFTIFRASNLTLTDSSEWTHITMSVDTTQASANDRMRLYVNGTQITSWLVNNAVTQNSDLAVSSAASHRIGSDNQSGSAHGFLDGYMHDIYFVDGQALDPTYFAGNDSRGNWSPKPYSGTYGTNGFHLDFKNRSNFGNDVSGNGNNWTVNNLDTTDSVIDAPKNNFVTWDSAINGGTLSQGNLEFIGNASRGTVGTTVLSQEKWYWEGSIIAANGDVVLGIVDNALSSATKSTSGWCTNGSDTYGYYGFDGRKCEGGSLQSFSGVTATTDDTVQVAVDVTNQKIWYGKNGVWLASGNPATGQNPASTITRGKSWQPGILSGNTGRGATINFGQSPNPTSTATTLSYSPSARGYFMYEPPAGFKALSSYTPLTLSKPANKLGLVGYWRFDEGTGSIATDFSGNGNHGTIGSSQKWRSGKLGNALTFNGTSDYVDTGNNQLVSGSNYMTVSAWIKTSSAIPQFAQIVGKNAGAWSWALQGDSAGNKVRFWVSGGNYTSKAVTNVAPNDGAWHHLVGTYDATLGSANTKLYVDGVLQSTTFDQVISIPSSADHEMIGAASDVGLGYFSGLIDEVRIYNRALSADEIAALYKSGAAKLAASSADLHKGSSLESGLVGHWTFDGKDLTDKVYDKSGNSNNGYVINSPTSTIKTRGKLGQGINLDGINDYVDVGTGSSLSITGPVTICAWVKADHLINGDFYHIVGNYSASTFRSPYNIYTSVDATNQGSFVFLWSAGGGLTETYFSATVLKKNEWHHMCGIRVSDSDVDFYFDGSFYNGTLISGNQAPTASASSVRIGDVELLSGTHSWPGELDDVRIYNRALSATEAKKLYQLGQAKIVQ